MSTKIPTLLTKIDSLPNTENTAIILDFYNYMQDKGSSENHISNNIKVILDLASFLGPLGYQDIANYRWFYNARSQEQNGHKELQDQLEWITPDFIKIKQKHTKA